MSRFKYLTQIFTVHPAKHPTGEVVKYLFKKLNFTGSSVAPAPTNTNITPVVSASAPTNANTTAVSAAVSPAVPADASADAPAAAPADAVEYIHYDLNSVHSSSSYHILI
ncbi:hypothetical protein HMPREF1544_10045 [Mucor circinelloides 1006PhL]|uniref:Uncharacterized protein n=1 Tax=Mucor circinelloides f. circinelloides (strain 1006PhL) TaxID=1220926 RepID=S2J4Y1_MUCC1|nr:hypothetical protein HMPREF1544_10045 [Mucor circinelloides 1006PhL]KAG1069383.1 hypothetical protein G6F42_026259 [Rhizopus arrhizus]